MTKSMNKLILFAVLVFSVACTNAPMNQVDAHTHVRIGINIPVYPNLVVVPGYPVYYAPQLDFNFFFYDGLYWVYQDDNWYFSSWYDGPWVFISPQAVPLVILQVPVRYYRQPPAHFRGWQLDKPPHWGDHWGRDWERQRHGWSKPDVGTAYKPAPLPLYQRQYPREKYQKKADHQHEIRQQNYNYVPRDPEVRKYYELQRRR